MSLLDIHASFTYSSIAPLIGLEPTTEYTSTAKCPYCGANSWSVYQDNRNLEEWHYCSQCKATGSIIAMAAERLEMSEIEVIQYLSDRKQNTLSADDIQRFHASMEEIRAFKQAWEVARNNVLHPTPVQSAFLKHIGWRHTSAMGPERIVAGPAQLYGIIDFRTLKKIIPRVAANFFGVKETSIVLVPYFNTPTRISGFNMITPKREMFLNRKSKTEFGFSGLQLILKTQSASAVVTSMLCPMMQLHMHNFTHSMTPLPIMAWRQPQSVRKQAQWSILEGRKIVLWEREPTAAIIHQAMVTGTNISFVGPTKIRKQAEVSGPRWRKWIHHDQPTDVLDKIVRSSRNCELALKNWTRSAPPESKIKLIDDAEKYDTATSDLIKKVLRTKGSSNSGRKISVNTITGAGGNYGIACHTVIIEKNDKWYGYLGQVRLHGILRVTHIVARPSGDREYVGYLKAEGKVIPYRVSESKADMKFLVNLGLSNGVYMQEDVGNYFFRDQRPEFFNPFEAACRFESPTVVAGLDNIGWDGSGFQLRNTKAIGGCFKPNPEHLLPSTVPGPAQKYCQLRPDVITALSKTGPEMEIAWALVIAVCAQVTAPSVDLDINGIVIHACPSMLFVHTLLSRLELTRGPLDGWKHKWPRVLNGLRAAVQKDITGFFIVPHMRNFTSKDLIVIDAKVDELEPRRISYSSDKIVLNYLREFTAHTYAYPDTWEKWLCQTYSNMQTYFKFVDKRMLKAAFKRIRLT